MKHDRGSKSKFCRNCFQPTIKTNFKKRVLICESNAPFGFRMPLESATYDFVNWEKMQKGPFDFYADLEAINVASAEFPRIKRRTGVIGRQ